MTKRIGLTGMRWAASLAVLVAACVFGGCTRNNGDIGDWFGTWQMTEVTADGVAEYGYEANVFWKFQNDVISLVRVNTGVGEHSRNQVWGTWADEDDYLYLDFTYSEDATPGDPNGTNQYIPLEETHLPYGEVSALRIDSRKGGEMRLKYQAADGVAYMYTLKKQ